MKTSITVDEDLWERFDVELRRRWRERSYSRGLERLIREWLEREESTASQGPTGVEATQARDAGERRALQHRRQNDYWHMLLDVVLESTASEATKAILRMFAVAVTATGNMSVEEIEEMLTHALGIEEIRTKMRK